MRKLSFIFLMVITFGASLFAQTGEKITCPVVDVLDPAEGTRVGDLVTFTAHLDTFGKKHDLRYNWHVNEGVDPSKSLEIVSGQGTRTITVRQVKGSVTATIEVRGPGPCLRTSSETAYVISCPKIVLTGPSWTITLGELLPYGVYVDTGSEKSQLEYVWAAVYLDAQTGKYKTPEILAGQGTQSVRIKVPAEGMTVSITIGGLPEGCPAMVSETAWIDPTPNAVMLEDFSGPITKFGQARIDKILAALKNDPNARLYVFIGAKTIHSVKDQEKETFVMEKFSKHGKYRILFSHIGEKLDVLQIWLVPAGGDEPEFKSKGGN